MNSPLAYYAGRAYDNYEPHFLDCCTLCNRTLNPNSDIFMYRGDKPFCSQECRQEQIEIDEADEKKHRLSSSKRSSTVRQTSESSKESYTKKAVRTGAVAVA